MPFLDQRRDAPVTGDTELEELDAYLDDIDGATLQLNIEVEYTRINGATPAAAKYAAAITQLFGVPLGIVAVRNIAGTTTWSQHAYGNAVDAMSTGGLLYDIAMFANANRGAFAIAHLLADPYFPSPLGDHYNHVHADFYPQYGGTPPGHPI